MRAWLAGCCLWCRGAAEKDEYFLRCSYLQQLRPWSGAWPGGCLVSAPRGDHSSWACEHTCRRNVYCSLWQYTGNQCLVSADSCEQGGVVGAGAVQGGGLIQHGTAAAISELPTDAKVEGLLHLDALPGAVEEEQAEVCRSVCYADVRCGFWQYGNGSCWVERHPHFKAMPANLTSATDLVLVGEQVVRGCPHEPHPIWLSVGVAGAVLGTMALIWAAWQGGSNAVTRQKLLKARAEAEESESFLSDDEDEEEATTHVE